MITKIALSFPYVSNDKLLNSPYLAINRQGDFYTLSQDFGANRLSKLINLIYIDTVKGI